MRRSHKRVPTRSRHRLSLCILDGDSTVHNRYDDQMKKLGNYPLRENIPVSAETIDSFEKELGFTLPEPYRVFLEKYGLSSQKGCATWPDLRRPGKPGGGVEVFYGLHSGQVAHPFWDDN